MHTKMMADMKGHGFDPRPEAGGHERGERYGKGGCDCLPSLTRWQPNVPQMMAKMSGMQNYKMAHMGEHMAQAGSAAMKQPRTECPMMQGITTMDHN